MKAGKDILSEYGPEVSGSRSSPSGGVKSARDVRDYQSPKGPSNINDPKGPGIHGTNHGKGGTQGHH